MGWILTFLSEKLKISLYHSICKLYIKSMVICNMRSILLLFLMVTPRPLKK